MFPAWMHRARQQHLAVRTRCASSTTGQLGSNVGLFAHASWAGLVWEASQQPGRQLLPAAAILLLLHATAAGADKVPSDQRRQR